MQDGSLKKITVDEFYDMTEEGDRVELIDGVIYELEHSLSVEQHDIKTAIGVTLYDYARKKRKDCKVFFVPINVKLDEYTSVESDIIVVSDPSRFDEIKLNGAPDLVVEVVSPFSRKRDMDTKMFLYERSGVKEYWIVLPEDKRVLVYNFPVSKIGMVYTFDDDIPVGIFKDAPEPLSVKLNDIIGT